MSNLVENVAGIVDRLREDAEVHARRRPREFADTFATAYYQDGRVAGEHWARFRASKTELQQIWRLWTSGGRAEAFPALAAAVRTEVAVHGEFSRQELASMNFEHPFFLGLIDAAAEVYEALRDADVEHAAGG